MWFIGGKTEKPGLYFGAEIGDIDDGACSIASDKKRKTAIFGEPMSGNIGSSRAEWS